MTRSPSPGSPSVANDEHQGRCPDTGRVTEAATDRASTTGRRWLSLAAIYTAAGAVAGVFKMSSMVGGALGVAVLSAPTRGFSGAAVENALHGAARRIGRRSPARRQVQENVGRGRCGRR
jgi:hypothetical protein